MSAKTVDKPFVLTVGEPAGIGLDAVLLAFQDCPDVFAQVVVVARQGWLESRAQDLRLSASIAYCGQDLQRGKAQALWVFDPCVGVAADIVAGKPSIHTAEAVLGCIRVAAQLCLQGVAAGLITAPIEKAVLRDAGFPFPGHTEFLADIAGVAQVVMMLASSQVRVALLTTHVALHEVPSLLNKEDTQNLIRITYHAMRESMRLDKPRLALCGLNPHAGEQGHFGREEIEVLTPALQALQAEGIMVDGPLPADTLFSADIRREYDAIVCCYHDQGLIPIKALSFGDAVNITLGLPFIRTSVDHGTALTRAGTGNISYTSLVAAMRMATSMANENIRSCR